jgi:hypothetical protein
VVLVAQPTLMGNVHVGGDRGGVKIYIENMITVVFVRTVSILFEAVSM